MFYLITVNYYVSMLHIHPNILINTSSAKEDEFAGLTIEEWNYSVHVDMTGVLQMW